MKNIIVSLSLMLATASIAHAQQEQFKVETIAGKKLTFTGIDDGIITDPYQGKIVFIEFWGTWCGPCLLSIPHHVKLQEKYKDQLRIVSFETTPKETKKSLQEYVKDPKNIDMSRVNWYMENKAKSPAQKKSLEEPVRTLKKFREAGKPINYDVVASADGEQFTRYIAQRAGWAGFIPYLLIIDGNGKVVTAVPGMPSEKELDDIIQDVLKKSKSPKSTKETSKKKS